MQSEEPSVIEYDLWRWHTDGAFPADQLPEQGYVHIGVYLAWLINHDMLDPQWVARSGADRAVAAVIARDETPCALRDVTAGWRATCSRPMAVNSRRPTTRPNTATPRTGAGSWAEGRIGTMSPTSGRRTTGLRP